MLSRAEQTLPASGANAYRIAELRSGPPSLRTRHPKHTAIASKTGADPAPPPTPAPQPKVAILLCTYQGQHYLEEQLMSFQAQSHPHWVLHVSDDGSSDDTRHILRRYQALLGADSQLIAQTINAKQVVSHDWWAYLLVSGSAVRRNELTQTA